MQRVIRFLLAMCGGACLVTLVGGQVHATPVAAARTSAVNPAAVEPPIATPGPVGDYLRAVHARLHGRWTENFVKVVSATYPPTHGLNNPSRQATVAMTIRWDGTIADSVVKKSSGSPEFDRAALDVARKGAPFPLPTPDVVSDDTYAHLEWTFARDHRACGADARVTRVDDPLDVSLPRLVKGNRFAEALRRVAAAKKDNDAGMNRFARLYLGRTLPDPMLNVAASMALVDSGDKSQAGRLRAAMGSRATVEIGARGLHKLGVDICDSVQEQLQTGTVPERELAMAAARAVATDGGDISRCAPALSAIVADVAQPKATRLSALTMLTTFMPSSAQPVVTATQQDKDPALRGAALLASVRKGAGRPETYRLAPLLHDKAVEVRGAASAGMVRAAGDGALGQLYLLARETDPRPGQLVAAELAQMTTHASAEFLGRMLKKNNLPVQIAAARALATRKDAGARAEVEAVKADDRVPREVRTIASGQPAVLAAPATGGAGQVATVAPSPATAPVREMLKQSRNRDAANWIVETFPSLEPRDAIEVMGAWLKRLPASAAAEESVPATASPPRTSAL